jgi:hypothetical protein
MTTASERIRRLLAVPRSRGAVSGFLLLALGAWGALIPFVGPYFHYAYTPDQHWDATSARLFLEVLPGAATVLGGLLLLYSRNRVAALSGGVLAAAAGAWFLVGPLLAPLFRANYLGRPVGGSTSVAVEQIGFFFGLGGAIVLLAAFALGRFSVISVRDVEVAEARARERDRQRAEADRPSERALPADVVVVAASASVHDPVVADSVGRDVAAYVVPVEAPPVVTAPAATRAARRSSTPRAGRPATKEVAQVGAPPRSRAASAGGSVREPGSGSPRSAGGPGIAGTPTKAAGRARRATAATIATTSPATDARAGRATNSNPRATARAGKGAPVKPASARATPATARTAKAGPVKAAPAKARAAQAPRTRAAARTTSDRSDA